MLNGITVLRFQDMSDLVRSRGKKTAQCTHCAMLRHAMPPPHRHCGEIYQTPNEFFVTDVLTAAHTAEGSV